MSDWRRDILRHALGLDRTPRVDRNYYATTPSCDNYLRVLALVGEGLMRAGKVEFLGAGGMQYFHVTPAGRVYAESA